MTPSGFRSVRNPFPTHIPRGTIVRRYAFGSRNPVGSHEITAPLGAGGMGEVYKARDTRLNRIAVGTYAGGSTQQDSGHVIFLENFIDELQRKAPLNGN